MTTTLANKYRPKSFDDVIGQDINVTVLKKQIENNTYSHAILFAGNAGCGKTTCARIFANMIDGEILEYDCASHNGVADVKEIVSNAKIPSLIYKYKVFILDECHTLSASAWSSLLITLEENLATSIFIFCTTDTQKIPNTIISRLQRFNFVPISNNIMLNRLQYVCNQENIDISEESSKCIVKASNGNMRQALTNLDKCLLYGNLDVDSVHKTLNIISDTIYSDLIKAINHKDKEQIIKIVMSVYANGYELHQFVRQFLDYALKNQTDLVIVDTILTIMQDIRYDDSPKNIIIARLILI